MPDVREYLAIDGRSPFGVWFAKVATALTRVPAGNFSNVKGVGSGLFECRIDFGPGYRIDGRMAMPLTRDFKETIRARVERDPKFRQELLREGLESMLDGDIATAKTILRDYINATVGFTELAQATRIPSKSLMRMMGPSGNPRASNLLEVVSFLQNREGVRFRVQVGRR